MCDGSAGDGVSVAGGYFQSKLCTHIHLVHDEAFSLGGRHNLWHKHKRVTVTVIFNISVRRERAIYGNRV